MKTIVIALGGNALLNPSGKQSFERESRNMDIVAGSIAALCKRGVCKIVVTHGNGSQVGDELARNKHAKKFVPELPLYTLNAETQATIGTVVEMSLLNNFKRLGLDVPVSIVLAHVLVDRNDMAFKRPSKQIGPFYSKKELREELRQGRFDYIKTRKAYRKVVASPMPKKIIEIESIKAGIKGGVVVTCGGGGIPVIKNGNRVLGINAVIDKDATTQLLANSISADLMVILTNSDYVYADFERKKGAIKETSAGNLKRVLDRFEEGTMKPKVRSCIRFIENGGKAAYIGNVYKLLEILDGTSGTKIV